MMLYWNQTIEIEIEVACFKSTPLDASGAGEGGQKERTPKGGSA